MTPSRQHGNHDVDKETFSTVETTGVTGDAKFIDIVLVIEKSIAILKYNNLMIFK